VRSGTAILITALAVAVALVVVGALLDTAPSNMVVWMLGGLVAMAIGLFLYGRASRR
jgi:hypothetical protein